jgi:hypothetical protein
MFRERKGTERERKPETGKRKPESFPGWAGATAVTARVVFRQKTSNVKAYISRYSPFQLLHNAADGDATRPRVLVTRLSFKSFHLSTVVLHAGVAKKNASAPAVWNHRSITPASVESPGCVVDSREGGTNDVWVAHSLGYPAAVSHLRRNLCWVVSLYSDPDYDYGTTGVAVDANGKIGPPTTELVQLPASIRLSTMAWVRPTSEFPFLTMRTRMTTAGSTIRAAPTTGSWAVVVDSTEPLHAWFSTRVIWRGSG